MQRLTRIPKHWLLVTALVLIAASGAAVAYAADANTVYACVDNVNGNARVVAAGLFGAKQSDCRQDETKLAWNIVGPQGPQGIQGPKGDTGAPGAPGTGGALADKVVTLAQNVTLHPGEQTSLAWTDTSNYSGYRVYARVTPYMPTPKITVFVSDGPGVAGEDSYGGASFPSLFLCAGTPCSSPGWGPQASGPPVLGQPLNFVAWTGRSDGFGHYPKLQVVARNIGLAGDPDATVSLYLLMFKN